jgi:flagellar assembly protein FliH
MATSSDWLAALAAPPALPPVAPAPRWFEARESPRGFCAGAPFGGRAAALADPAPEPDTPPPAPDAAAHASLEAAQARAFAEGELAGRAAAEAEAREDLAHARALRLNFRALDAAALGVLAEELAATVEALCAEVLGEYARDPAALAARCEAAAARLGGGWAGAVLHLHPDDAASLPPGALAGWQIATDPALERGALAGWQIATDPALERGALVIEGPDGAVRDTPADWRRALAEAVRP